MTQRAMAMAGILAWASTVLGATTNDTGGVPTSYFIGYEREPAMDYGGRTLVSLDGALCRGLGEAIGWREHTFAALFYEGYVGGFLSVVQHEGMGHGGRAREFGLDPSYSFGLDLSGSTSVGKDPESALQNVLLAAGGMEADGVMAQRLLHEFYSGSGTDGAKVPLLAFAKMDFSLYCWSTPDPAESPQDFQNAYEDGNDVAYYLTARQAHRSGTSPADVWNTRYAVDAADPLLSNNYDDLQRAALWNLIDPAFWLTTYSYVVDHLGNRQERLRPPVLPLGEGVGLTAGTRAFLGPDYVTSYLDLYLVTCGPLVQVYGRTLESSTDTSSGYGAAIHHLQLGPRIAVGAQADQWKAPDSVEKLDEGSGWNVMGEVDTLFAGRWGVSVKAGVKSDGWLPGTPVESGVYGGAGVQFAF